MHFNYIKDGYYVLCTNTATIRKINYFKFILLKYLCFYVKIKSNVITKNNITKKEKEKLIKLFE